MANEFIARNGLIAQNNSTVTGSLRVTQGISGSFSGSGANLFNIPASGITGLRLSQISSGSTSASISPTAGFVVNTNVTITGSLSQGINSLAAGLYSHAEGANIVASGDYSHAEGNTTTAQGGSSHAEGGYTYALGDYSHAEGYYTVALGAYQHVQGQYNLSSSVEGAFIHGNGTSDLSRSNLIFTSESRVEITGSLTVTNPSGDSLLLNSSGNSLIVTSSQGIAAQVVGGSNNNNIALFKSIPTNSTVVAISSIGNIFTSGSLTATQGITGSLFGTASYALTASNADFLDGLHANSFVLNSQTSSMNVLSSSYALTASYIIEGTTLTTQEEGSTLSSTVTTLNFVGAGVVASGTGDTTTVTIAGGGSGGTSLGLVQAFSVGLQNIF